MYPRSGCGLVLHPFPWRRSHNSGGNGCPNRLFVVLTLQRNPCISGKEMEASCISPSRRSTQPQLLLAVLVILNHKYVQSFTIAFSTGQQRPCLYKNPQKAICFQTAYPRIESITPTWRQGHLSPKSRRCKCIKGILRYYDSKRMIYCVMTLKFRYESVRK